MSFPRPASPAVEAEDAVARVLEAERRARDQVSQCEQQAARLVADAKARAVELRERTEVRLERLLKRMADTAETRLGRIRAEQAELARESHVDPATLAHLDDAIAQLVVEIAARPADD